MKRRLALAWALVLALTLFGCAKNTQSVQQPEAQPAAPVVPAPAAPTEPEVENNGGYYVRVGDKVYFRRYGRDALEKTAVFGEFTGTWVGINGGSELMAYDPVSGGLETVCAESGFGPLWYADGGFYLCERMAGDNYVVWYALDGSRAETLCPGTPLGVTESGLLAVEAYTADDSGWQDYVFYREKKEVGALRGTDAYYIFGGLTDDGLFLLDAAYGEDEAEKTFYQLTVEGKLIRLGVLPKTESDEAEPFYDVQVDRFAAANGKVAFGVGYYMGTGSFLGETIFVEADVGQENSLRELTIESGEEEGDLPYLTANADGTFSAVPALPGAVRVSWSDDGRYPLEVFENGAWRALIPNFCDWAEDGWDYRRVEQHLDYVDGRAYVTLACAYASPMDSIGWRDAYTLLDMLYLCVEPDGTEREITRVDHDASLYGDVWFIEGESLALWRQRRATEEDEYYIPEGAYLIPIAEDAEWEGGWETVFDGTTGLLPYDYGEDAAGYYGCPIPDSEPAGRLTLKLNADGEIVYLARREPDTLLAIDFDVPESTLAGAAAKLPLERRAEDEDTLWFWAKISALEDGVRVRVERTPDNKTDMDYIAEFDGAFIVGKTLCDVTLDRGEFIAVRASLPWHPELRVSVSKNGAWGSYVFGEDNWMHLWTEESVHPRMTITAYPAKDDLLADLCEGAWVCRDPETGETAGVVSFDPEGRMTAGGYTFDVSFERLYAELWESCDLLCLTNTDERLQSRYGASGGDYLMELAHTGEEDVLYLLQANNGDAALPDVLAPEAKEPAYRFTLTRSRGAGMPYGTPLRDATFIASAERYDKEKGIVWLREARIAGEGEYEGMGPVYRLVNNAPCLAYPVAGTDANLALQRAGTYPMTVFKVTVNSAGEVESLAAPD